MRGTTVGVLGLGRFGAAFGELLAGTGARVVGFDPVTSRRPGHIERLASLEQVCARSDFLVLATPVPAMRETLRAAVPHLDGRTIVLDVGSVKVTPARDMEAALGTAIPWVATHPLFGPVSLALGERPRTVVVCPNPLHPEAVRHVRALLSAAGCVLVERSPDEHDREMAQTHALAYLIAKGVIDAELSLDSEIAPPSARAIARTIESARADSGHLLVTLHRHNPFAADVRRRFLDALTEADRALSAQPSPTDDAASSAPRAEPRLPDLGDRSPELREVRELIDDVDRELLQLLARRLHLARRAGRAKSAIGHGVRDQQRERELLQRHRKRARDLDLPEGPVARLFERILALSREVQGEGSAARD